MLYFYCRSIIIFQVAYILAHSLFLDITLNYISKGSNNTKSFGYYITETFVNSSYYNPFIDMPITLLTSFILIYIFYFAANTFKEKI